LRFSIKHIFLILFVVITTANALTYKVKSGDTLSEIAQKYGVTVEDIIEVNNLRPPYVIYKGQRLKIPDKRNKYKYYKVKSGDTLSEIAEKYRVSVKDIIRANRLKRPYIVRVGQILRIPNKNYKPTTSSKKKTNLANCSVTHKVKRGENIVSIAKKYHVWVKDIKKLNNLKDGYLYEGQVLCIKPAYKQKAKSHKRTTTKYITKIIKHKVRKGESLSLIAKKYHVPVTRIISYNKLKKPYYIYPGQTLKIPVKVKKTITIEEKQENYNFNKKIKLGFIWPVDGEVISKFANSPENRHLGIDIKTECGVPIKATEDGKVIYAGDSIKAYGNLIVIRHRNKLTSVYGHVGKIFIKENQWVKKGQVIGQTGKLNNSEFCGLYFEIRKKTVPIDPLVLLNKNKK
jgi:LysM repeat protein